MLLLWGWLICYSQERSGDYLRSTVQVRPHITNRIQELITKICTGKVDPPDNRIR